MSTNTLLKTARFLSLSAGAILTASGQQALFAQLLSGPGSLVIDTNLRAAAPLTVEQSANGTMAFVMGAALLMVGLMLHALLGNHQPEKVRITVKPRYKRVAQWFWVQMKV